MLRGAPDLLFLGYVLDVGVDPPVVAERIDNAGTPIAVEHVLCLAKRRRPRLERPLIHLVDVLAYATTVDGIGPLTPSAVEASAFMAIVSPIRISV